jgi:cytochrome P450/nitrite reductase/ring-hydroxylating ferredoxin subunit
VRVARVEDLRGDGLFALSGGGVEVVAVRTAAGLKAYQGLCPHQGALLGEGELDGDTLVCRNHRWRFSAETGQRVGGPECLVACPIEARDGELWADVSPLQAKKDATGPRRRVRDLPGPRGLPLLGNALQFEPSRSHQILDRWAAEHGPIYRLRLGPNQAVAVADPDLNERILRARPGTYRRTSIIAPVLDELGGDGVFSAEGAAWRPQRHLAMHALSYRNQKVFYPALRTITERLHKRWEAKADAGEVLDMSAEVKRFLVDTTTLLAFGHDVNTIDQEGDVIQERLELILPAVTKRLFALLPTWRWFRTPADRRLDRAVDEIHAWLTELIDRARARLGEDPRRAERPGNFIEAMLTAKDDAGRPFPDDVIMANAMTMIMAGEDTTAYATAWAVHHLCDSPRAVARLRAEADGILDGACVPMDIETAERLTYAGAVANEAMRLRPIVPYMLLEANHDVVIGDVQVPSGTWVVAVFRPAVMDAENFHEPGEFLPERWLDGQSEGRRHEQSRHMPFGSGPRICPGRMLALLEMKSVLSMLYRSFEVDRVGDAAEVEERFFFTLTAAGLKVRLRRRAAPAAS